MDIRRLDDRLRRLWRAPHWRLLHGCDGATVSIGLGEAGPRYRWSGLRRSDGVPGRAILQLTLAGAGWFRSGTGTTVRVEAGRCFLAIVPSDHEYGFAPEDGRWRFCWITSSHPWYVERVRRAIATAGHCPPGGCGDGLLGAVLRLHHVSAPTVPADAWSVERTLVELATAIGIDAERRAAGGERERLLALVRTVTRAAPTAPPSVSDLARREGCSRTALAHRFRSVTGSTVSQAIRAARMEMVYELLAASDLPIAEVAERCGFAAANHLCRVFRLGVGTTPARWRATVAVTRP